MHWQQGEFALILDNFDNVHYNDVTNGRDCVSNHQPHDCLLNRLFRRRWKKTSKLRVNGLCVANSAGTGDFPAQRDSNAENASIWWRHHVWLRCWNHDLIIFLINVLNFRYHLPEHWPHGGYCVAVLCFSTPKIFLFLVHLGPDSI